MLSAEQRQTTELEMETELRPWPTVDILDMNV